MASITYTGSFGSNSAGANGRTCTMRGNALPSNATITSIDYTIAMRAGGYNGINQWIVHWFAIGGEWGSPGDWDSSTKMSSHVQTLYGSMGPNSAKTPFQNGSFTLYAKVNSNHSSTSYMGDVTITVYYTTSSSGGSGSGTPSYTKATATVTSSVTANGSAKGSVYIYGQSGLTYTVSYKIGSYTGTIATKTSSTSLSFTVPKTVCQQIPSATSGNAVLTVTTYNGSTSLGSNTYNFSIVVPTDVVPTVGSLNASLSVAAIQDASLQALLTQWNVYVQGFTGVTLGASSANGSYGSTIKSYTFRAGTLTQSVEKTANSCSAVFSILVDAGTSIPLSVYVTDSRGRKSQEQTLYVRVYECSPPKFTLATAYRAEQSGTVSEIGDYILATLSGSISSVGGKNSASRAFYYKKDTESDWHIGHSAMTDGIGSLASISASFWEEGNPVRVKFVMQDALGQKTEQIVPLGMLDYTLFFKRGGLGMGVGMQTSKADQIKAVEFAPSWELLHGTGKRNVGSSHVVESWSATNNPTGSYDLVIPAVVLSSEEPTPIKGLIWLKPSV